MTRLNYARTGRATEKQAIITALIRSLNKKYGKGTWRSRSQYGYGDDGDRMIERRNEYGHWIMVGWVDEDAGRIEREYLGAQKAA